MSRLTLVLATTVALAAAACSGADDQQTATPAGGTEVSAGAAPATESPATEPPASDSTAGQPSATEAAAGRDDDADGGATGAGSGGEDGRRLDAAGAATYRVTRNPLRIIDVEPAAGWRVTEVDNDDDDDEAELTLRRDRRRVEVEVDDDDGGRLRIDTCVRRPGTNRPFDVADAGSVHVRADGGRLTLEDFGAEQGWDARVTERDDDEIDIRFTREGQRVEFIAEADDDDDDDDEYRFSVCTRSRVG